MQNSRVPSPNGKTDSTRFERSNMLIFNDKYAHISLGNPAMPHIASESFWEKMAKDLDNCELHGFKRLIISCNIEQQQNDRDVGNSEFHFEELVEQVISRIIIFTGNTVFAGGGEILGRLFEIALACQFRIGTETTEFGFGPTLGKSCDPIDQSLAIIKKLIADSEIVEMILLGTLIKARSAFASGLISEVVTLERLESSASLLAQRVS